jgi:hypothetical protein
MTASRHSGAPIKARNKETLSRDIAHLTRMKNALMLDDDISAEESDEIGLLVDKLTILLIRLKREMK